MKRKIEYKVWCYGTHSSLNFNKPQWWTIGSYMLNKYFNIPNIFDGQEHEEFNTHFELVEYSGYSDKTKTKIYEGDVVRVPHHYNSDYNNPGGVGIVKYDDGFYIDGFYVEDFGWGAVEIIGNIFENPELVQVMELL